MLGVLSGGVSTKKERDMVSRHASGRLGGDDEGQASLMLIPIVVGLVALSITFLLPLGDAVDGRTQTRTAADAAALAAAEAWKADLILAFDGAVEAPGEGQAYGLLQQLLRIPLAEFGRDTEAQARLFADRNKSTVLSVAARPSVVGMEYRVRTRSRQLVEETAQYTYAEATARVELRSGLCFLGDGTRLGLVVRGVCASTLPALPVPALPAPVEGLPPLEVPEVELPALPVGPPEGLGRLVVRVRLVE